MRKFYPYLQDPYIYNSNKELEKRNFLAKIDDFVNQKHHVRITLLTWEEEPIKDIEGILTSGSMSKDGSSAVRTTGSLTCEVNYGEYHPQDLKMDYSINKKVFIEVGTENQTDEYPEYPILWFPQGVFFISSFSINSSSESSVSLSIGLKDKMAGLNGDIGGTFPVVTKLDTMSTQLKDGSYAEQKVLIYNIIQELVHHYGNEDLNNIIIEGIPERIRRVVKWNGTNPLYLIQGTSENYPGELDISGFQYQYTLKKPEDEVAYITFHEGEDVGYVLEDFHYPKELTVNAGTAVTGALDTISKLLGNYEYFYDEYGIFHFREVKNYLNTTQGKLVLDEVAENPYLVEFDNSKSVYAFTDDKNILNISVSPNYSNIKNDFVVLGLRQSTSNQSSAQIMYHLAIDDKPELIWDESTGDSYYGIYGTGDGTNSDDEIMILYTQEETKYIVAGFAKNVESLPDVGNSNLIYHLMGGEKGKDYFMWDEDKVQWRELYNSENTAEAIPSSSTPSGDPSDPSQQEETKKATISYKSIAQNDTLYITCTITGNWEIDTSEGGKKAYSVEGTALGVLNAWQNAYETWLASNAAIIGVSKYSWPAQGEYEVSKSSGDLTTDQKVVCTIAYGKVKEWVSDECSSRLDAWNSAFSKVTSDSYSITGTSTHSWPASGYYTLNEVHGQEQTTMGDVYISYKLIPDNKEISDETIDYNKDDSSFKGETNPVMVFTGANPYKAKDWRTKLYLDGLRAKVYGLESNYYAAELEAYWPQTYDLINQRFYGEAEGSGDSTKTYKLNLGIYYNSQQPSDKDVNIGITYSTLEKAIKKGNELLQEYGLLEKDAQGKYLIPDMHLFEEDNLTISCIDNINPENPDIVRGFIESQKGIKELITPEREWVELSQGNYFLDFIDAKTAALGKYGVNTIGRRTRVLSNQEINCLFQPEIPNVNFLNIDSTSQYYTNNASQNTGASQQATSTSIEDQRAEVLKYGYAYTQVGNEIYENLVTGGDWYGAFEEIKNQLYLYTYYQTNLNLTTLPIFYLQPNSRVTVQENSTNTNGSFVIKSLSFEFGLSSSMNISLNEVAEKM